MPKIAFLQLLCCLVLILDVGDTRGESSSEAATDAAEKQLSSALVIIKQLEEENAEMATNYAAMAKNSLKERDELREQMAKEREELHKQMAQEREELHKQMAQEREELHEQMAQTKNSEKEREEFRKEIRRVGENKDSKINKKNKRQLKELQGQNKQLQGQLQEYKSREAKRLKDAVNPKSANGSLHRNSSRMDADNGKPFCKRPGATTCPVAKTCPVAETCPTGPTMQLFTLKKTWSEARSHCKSLGGDLATFPDTTYLGRDEMLTGNSSVWLGGRCDGAEGECHRGEQKKQWKWIGGGEISYDLKYWNGCPNNCQEPFGFNEPGCILLGGSVLGGYNCETNKFNFLCQF